MPATSILHHLAKVSIGMLVEKQIIGLTQVGVGYCSERSAVVCRNTSGMCGQQSIRAG